MLASPLVQRDRFLPSLKRQMLVLSAGASILFSAASWSYELKEEGLSDEQTLSDALTKANVALDFRLRYEDVSKSKPVSQGAQALTLRSRLALETQRFHLFSAGLRFDDIRALPDDRNYFSGSNGETDDLLVADPEITELSNLWVAYDIANTLIKYGKQDYELNNGRLISTQAWRQNSHTFDGLSVRNESLNYTKFEFARFTRFENAYDPDIEQGQANLDINVYGLSYRGFWLNDISLYGVTIDGKGEQADWSTETYGLSFDGEAGDQHAMALMLDYAVQVDKDRNPNDYKAKYLNAQLTLAYEKRFGLTLGYEKLGAQRDGFFVTPLADLHGFQGWTDVVTSELGNIAGGIRDRSLSVFALCDEHSQFSVNYHNFSSANRQFGLGDLGREWSAQYDYVDDRLALTLKYAKYEAKALAEDQRKLWLSVAYGF